MLTIRSRSHDYTVEWFDNLPEAVRAASQPERAFYLVDDYFSGQAKALLPDPARPERLLFLQASETQKSFEALAPVFLAFLERGLKRDGVLVVVGGGVLQDIGCFIASVLFRGLRWELVPTTFLAQADSCIGSKSSINIGRYKNQIGTFYPPHRVLIAAGALASLPWDEVRSGLGEVIKLQLLSSEAGLRELMADLQGFRGQPELLAKWVLRSLEVKRPYIEADEFDRGIRNILNYGHTFGHGYESATHYAIPHGISVLLGILTATFLSARLGLVSLEHYQELKQSLAPWHHPYGRVLQEASHDHILQAIRHDKKNTGTAVNCILTRGFGRMEKTPVPFDEQLAPAVKKFVENELTSC